MNNLERHLAERLLTQLVELLPPEDRDTSLRDWIADGQAERHPLTEALKMIPAAWNLRQPYQVDPADEVPVARRDRVNLALLRLGAHLLSGFLILTILLILLANPTPLPWVWCLEAAMLVTFMQWLVRRGLDWDSPWLRGTAAGSLVLLSVTLGPMLTLTLIPGSNPGANVLVFCWFMLVMTWDAYWSVQRPLRKKGAARLFMRK